MRTTAFDILRKLAPASAVQAFCRKPITIMDQPPRSLENCTSLLERYRTLVTSFAMAVVSVERGARQ
jgi:hypothetical protein